jgi:CP family cyanate transporter-like MFS transporter
VNLHRVSPAAIVILSGIIAALHLGKVGPAIPVLSDSLGLTLVQAGFLLSLIQLAGMLTGVFVGIATDKAGLLRSIITGQLILCVASLAGMWASQAYQLLFLRALEGFGFLLAALPAPALLRQLVDEDKLTRVIGFWGAYMPIGTSLAFIGCPLLIAHIAWQGTWGVLAGISAIVIVLLYYCVPGDLKRLSNKEQAVIDKTPWQDVLRTTLRHAAPWQIGFTFALYSFQWIAVIGFLPSVYNQAGITGQVAGALTALASIVNVIGNITAGQLLHRGLAPAKLLAIGFTTMMIATMVAFDGLTAQVPVLRYIAILVFSATGGMIPATLFVLAVTLAPGKQTVSTTIGWVQQVSATGQFLGPPLVGWVAHAAGGWQLTWIVTSLACITGLMIAHRLHRRRKQTT